MERQLAVKIPGCPAGQQPSLFGASPSGAFVAAGNANGDIYVYDTVSGERMCHCKVRGDWPMCGIRPWRTRPVGQFVEYSPDRVPEEESHCKVTLGLHAAIKPLLSRSTTEEFNSPPKYSQGGSGLVTWPYMRTWGESM
eukprot:1186063-Prorocentrum_minimum.AAC.2